MQGSIIYSNGVRINIDHYLNVKGVSRLYGCGYTDKHHMIGNFIYKGSVPVAKIIGIEGEIFHDDIIIMANVQIDSRTTFKMIIDAFEPRHPFVKMILESFRTTYEIRKI